MKVVNLGHINPVTFVVKNLKTLVTMFQGFYLVIILCVISALENKSKRISWK